MRLIIRLRFIRTMVLIAFLPWLLSACACRHPKPGRYAIEVKVEESLAEVAMQLDFVADPTFTKEHWEGLNVNSYWPDSA